MKADQINRFMRVNGRKNLWLLRNTNQLYENAVKSYYDRSTSLLPYDPASQNVKMRDENRAPVRALTMRKNSPVADYPRNHSQMADQAANATSGQLLNTVMQANRRRSMSFTAGGLRMCGEHIINNRNSGYGRRRRDSSTDGSSTAIGGSKGKANALDLSILNGRSMSLPPRTTLELGMGYALGKGKGPPSCKHHLIAIEKSSNACAVSLARRQRQRSDYDCDSDQLMVVDEALKQRLAMRFNRQPDDEPSAAGFRLGLGRAGLIDRRQLPRMPKQYNMRSAHGTQPNVNREQTHFQNLGERIKQFKVIQFADGPVNSQAFNRRPGYADGRIHSYDNRHLPKQEPCLSFHNVLHTNHRQRSLNYQTRSQSLETNPGPGPTGKKGPSLSAKRNAPPLEPLEPLAPNWRPQQQQQQHPHKSEALARLATVAQPILPLPLAGLHNTKLKRFRTPANISKSRSKRSVQRASSKSQLLGSSKNKIKVKDSYTDNELAKQRQRDQQRAKELEQQQLSQDAQSEARVQAMMQSIAKASPDLTSTSVANKISRTSHLLYMKENTRRHERPAASAVEQTPPSVKKPKVTRKDQEVPKQPLSAKGAHNLLAASASQVSAFKRAFKNRQQIIQAEMLHNHAQLLPDNQHLMQQQQLHRLQQLEHQQRMPVQQALSKPSSYIPAATKKYTTSQHHRHGAGEPKSLAQQPPMMHTIKTKVQQQQQQLLRHAAAMQKTRHEPAAKQPSATQQKLPLPLPLPLPQPQAQRANNLQPTSSQLPVEVTSRQRGIAAPCLAYTCKSAGQATVTSQSLSASYQRQQQQQLHQQLRQRRQQPFESLWRHT